MERRRLGKTDIEISPIIFGAWAVGGWLWGGTDEKNSVSAIQMSLDHGINAIDTAPMYGMGYSEELVAKAIKGRRHQVIIATKCGLRWDTDQGSDPWEQRDLQNRPLIIRHNSNPASIQEECEKSLKRLQTDYIDLYQIHWPDSTTPVEESWKEMVRLKKEGKVRAIGVSNYSLEQLQQIHAIHPVDSLQPPYSLVRRSIENDLLPFCQKNQISVLVYSPLERGLLTGKITPGYQFPKDDHRASSSTFSSENRTKIQEAFKKIRPLVEKYGATPAQVILYCTLSVPGITATLVGARNAQQALENAKTLSLHLKDQERDLVIETLKEYPLSLDEG